jgi:hypothetical protein
MRNLVFAGCALAFATLASCHDDAGGSEPLAAAVTQQAVVLTKSSVGLVPTKTAKGISVDLHGRFQNAVIARRSADGTLVTECHDDPQAAEAFVNGTAPASQKVETK